MKIDKEFDNNIELTDEFPEGKIVERTHKARERNTQVVILAKENFKKQNGKLYCQVCGFDFEKTYGSIGVNFIEGHHTIAVSEMKEEHKTKVEDIAMLCANCHRMVHKKRPWLTMKDLNKLVNRK
nr:HNH endonuclease [Bacteroidota bacterium]